MAHIIKNDKTIKNEKNLVASLSEFLVGRIPQAARHGLHNCVFLVLAHTNDKWKTEL